MRRCILFFLLLIVFNLFLIGEASQPSKSQQPATKTDDQNGVFIKKLTTYRAFQPAYHRLTFNKVEVKPDYDRSYEAEYDGMVANFTASIYDDNPPIYPNPDSYQQSEQVPVQVTSGDLEPELDIPDDSLADSDLRDHNIIDSVTYLYGFTGCKCRPKWKILILIATGISVLVMSSTVLYLVCSESAKRFRSTQIYVICLNLCGTLGMCTVIYFQAVLGVVGPWWCERVALLLHYSHLSCSAWVVLLSSELLRAVSKTPPRPIRYYYLLGYGLTGVLVMFNYALSMEHYETRHYCWMSIEKGMVIGCMAPVMVLIFINTFVVIQGLRKINRIQGAELNAKLQELIHQHVSNIRNIGMNTRPGKVVDEPPVYDSPISNQSRKNTDSSSSTTDKENSSEDEGQNYITAQRIEKYDYEFENISNSDNITEQDILNYLYFDRLATKAHDVLETSHIKALLQLCLVLEPFFAVNWVMGVVAVENAEYWPTPALYLILLQIMYIYVSVTLCTNLPSQNEPPPPDGVTLEPELKNNDDHSVIVVTNVLVKARSNCMRNLKLSRSIDIVPLLEPKQTTPSVGQNDTISTISI